jgi:hypothetical protein
MPWCCAGGHGRGFPDGVLMPLIAGGPLVTWWRKWLPARAWVVAVVLQAILLASGLLALETGEDDEDRVEALVSGFYIDAHKEAAERFVWEAGAVLAVMLSSAFMARKRAGLPLAAGGTCERQGSG